MSADRAIGRYRRWYGRLLRLYPRPFRDRFAESMTQTFTDLARERAHDRRSLIGFALRSFADTSTGILRENLAHMTTQPMHYVRWVLVTAVVLAVPALLMAFDVALPDPGSGSGGVNWGPVDFAAIGVIVLGSGLLYEYACSRGGSTAHRAAVGIAVLASLGLVWVNLAVGFMKVESGNVLYALVLLVAVAGVAIGRFQPLHASNALFAAAGVHAAVAVIGLVAGMGPTLLADAFWIAGWIAAALLFRQASEAAASVA